VLILGYVELKLNKQGNNKVNKKKKSFNGIILGKRALPRRLSKITICLLNFENNKFINFFFFKI